MSSDDVHKSADVFKNFTSKTWSSFDTDKKLVSLKELELYVAKKQGRDAREIKNSDTIQGVGAYSVKMPDVLCVDLKKLNPENNPKLKNRFGYDLSGYLAMATVIHEGRHSYQHDAVNNKPLNDNTYSEETLKEIGQNLLSPIKGGAPNYIAQSSESDAFKYTIDTLSGLSGQLKRQFSHEDFKAFEEFFENYKKTVEETKDIAKTHYNVDTFDLAERKTAQEVAENHEKLTKDAEKAIAEIKKYEGKRKAEKIKTDFEKQHPYSPQETLRLIKSLDNNEGLVVKEKSGRFPMADANIPPKPSQIRSQQGDQKKDDKKPDLGTIGDNPDVIAKLRERVASQGIDAVKAFDNSAQFDPGVLIDLNNKSNPMPTIPDPIPSPSTLPDQELVNRIIQAQNAEQDLKKQLANTENPVERKALEAGIKQSFQANVTLHAEITKRPNWKELIEKKERVEKLVLSQKGKNKTKAPEKEYVPEK
jgi:hypothetical protein